MEDFWLIKRYIELLTRGYGMDIIIYDDNGLLSHTPLAELEQVGKWHTNPYCLKIKENKALHRRCVWCKRYFDKTLDKREGVIKGRCHCVVVEYIIPIKIKNRLVCMVAATGFFGALRPSVCNILAKRVGISPEELLCLRESMLKKVENEYAVTSSLELLAELVNRYVTEKTEIPGFFGDFDLDCNEYVLRAMEYIHQNFVSPINVEAVATHCHISVSYLQHLFVNGIGHGVAEEIRLCRLAYAKELLCTTDYSMRYISFISGFVSYDYFFTAFKKRFSISPLQYRKRYKK